MTTEEDTFKCLRRTPISTNMLDTIDSDECSVDEFKDRINSGCYNTTLKKLGWEASDFYIEYSVWIARRLNNLYPEEYPEPA